MPELPEVEAVRKSLQDTIVGHTIEDIIINRESAILKAGAEQSIDYFYKRQIGQTFGQVCRRAKHLIIHLETGDGLISHLKMSGGFRYMVADTPISKHSHIIWQLSNGYHLRFIDQRCFGYVGYHDDVGDIYSSLSDLAPEPLSVAFDLVYWREAIHRLSRLRAPLKAILLDQSKLVSGLGNIYVDEILFASGVHPTATISQLTEGQIDSLYTQTQRIIGEAIARGGTTFRDYIDAHGKRGQYADELMVYGRDEQPCRICGTEISYQKVAGRGTHVCSQCQGG
jgi:formamidopyrimidine-DNA glycosylase